MKRVRSALVVLLVSLFLFHIGFPVRAGTDAVNWMKVNLPAEGKSGNWVLAKGASVQHLTQANDGTLYGYANPTGTTYTLFKSKDGGRSWTYTGEVKDIIVDIATAPDNANVVYYATVTNVYQSTDGAASFNQLPPRPGGAGGNNISITSVDVSRTANYYTVAVGTRDADAAQFGGVYLYDESKSLAGWQDTTIGGYDIYDIAFSPRPVAGEIHLAAVANNEASTRVMTKVGINWGWGAVISDAVIPLNPLVSADIAFPDNYGSSSDDFLLYTGLNTGTNAGDVYIVYGGVVPNPSSAIDVNIGFLYGLGNVDITSVAASGSSRVAKVLAGAAGSAQVYSSTDGGINWKRSNKPPTGATKTYVLMASDFNKSGRAYAATSGTEGAFSVTAGDVLNWNQLSLINTQITNIVALSLSPNYGRDNTLFLLTFSGKHSLWRSENGGAQWERIFSSVLPNVSSLGLVRLSPEYGNDARVVFVTGNSGGNPILWKSGDNGQSFATPRVTYDPNSGATFAINQCVVVDDDNLIFGSVMGANGLIYRTRDGGLSYSGKAIVGNVALNAIVTSPDYKENKTVLVGNTAGWVYWSDDGGASFEPLPLDATTAPLTGNISVAFDPGYSRNKTIYAAGDTAGKGIYRFVIGRSTRWESIDSTLPAGSIINQLLPAADGTLYAANAKAGTGIERSLNPTLAAGPTFETVLRSLDSSAKLTGLWMAGNRLWSVDTANTKLMTLVDTLTRPVILTEPPVKSGGIETRNVNLRWEAVDGATTYKWQVDNDAEFTSVPAGFEDTTQSISARLPALEPATTYYWRVRVTEPVSGPWSARWSFTTTLSGEIIAPKLFSPEVGTKVIMKPILQWGAVAGAENYELLIDTDYTFVSPAVKKMGPNALPTTAWQCEVSLNPDTTYYWKVRASGSNSFSAWSNTGVFITESAPVIKSSPHVEITPAKPVAELPQPPPQPITLSPAPLPPPAPPSPATSPSPTTIVQIQQATPEWVNWLVYLGGALLLTMVGLLITMVIVVVKISRYD